MARLVLFALVSVDGFVADPDGNFDWHEPDEEVHQFINTLHARYSDHLYDERSYEIMKYWEHPPDLNDQPPVMREYAQQWQRVRKTVISSILTALDPAHYTVWPTIDVARVQALKASARADILIESALVSAQLVQSGLLDEIEFLTVPVLLGSGTPCFGSKTWLPLTLLQSQAFASGWVYHHYRVIGSAP